MPWTSHVHPICRMSGMNFGSKYNSAPHSSIRVCHCMPGYCLLSCCTTTISPHLTRCFGAKKDPEARPCGTRSPPTRGSSCQATDIPKSERSIELLCTTYRRVSRRSNALRLYVTSTGVPFTDSSCRSDETRTRR
ncbi:hypothetical protein CERSUDRAFT_117569 [Gelatoporia subvermispora B]|uniref:Uncharacterized protein n=1 Tax=Ceriporiopsis subvermispora (strain B) TaxID=914234 RepID=M2R581_CERS8|nr:hypothetical protein CERSUDRAFT_117569 [Gelatoporia subvermispora B]